MYEYYFTFQSMTRAQTAQAVLTRHGLFSALRRTPKVLTAQGCGYALRLAAADGPAAAALLRREGSQFGRCFRLYADGWMEEVGL